MARSFLGFGQVPYIGTLQAFPNYLNPGGFIVPASFNWLSYGAATARPNINVLCQMTAISKLRDSWQIKSIYIDNLGSGVPIYVYFSDTGFTVAAQPNSAAWYPVYTNNRVAAVIGLGFSDGNIPSTLVYFSDAPMVPYSDLEFPQSAPLLKASPTISQGLTLYNQNYGTPALGDQANSWTLDMSLAPGTFVQVFPISTTQDYYYVTSMSLVVTAQISNLTGTARAVFQNNAGSFIKFDLRWLAQAIVNSQLQNFTLVQLSNMNLKLDGTQGWQLANFQNIAGTCNLILSMSYTRTPLP